MTFDMRVLLSAALLAVPPIGGGAHAQPVPLDSTDSRLEVVRPLADLIVKAEPGAVADIAATYQPDAVKRPALAAQIRAIVDACGGDGYSVKTYVNGGGRDVIVELNRKSDGSPAAFIVQFEGDSNQIANIFQVRVFGQATSSEAGESSGRAAAHPAAPAAVSNTPGR